MKGGCTVPALSFGGPAFVMQELSPVWIRTIYGDEFVITDLMGWALIPSAVQIGKLSKRNLYWYGLEVIMLCSWSDVDKHVLINRETQCSTSLHTRVWNACGSFRSARAFTISDPNGGVKGRKGRARKQFWICIDFHSLAFEIDSRGGLHEDYMSSDLERIIKADRSWR